MFGVYRHERPLPWFFAQYSALSATRSSSSRRVGRVGVDGDAGADA